MRPSTTAFAFGAATALALSPVSAAEPPSAGEPARTGQAPASVPGAAPSSSPQAEPKTAPAPEPTDAAPVPSPDDGASPGATRAPEPSPRPASPVAPLRPRVRAEAAAEQPIETVTPARDTVGGHFVVGVDAGLVIPFGSIASGIPQSRTMGPGLSIGGDLAYGISRTVMLGAYIDVGLPSAEGASSKNSISTIAAGPLIRYHLAQGIPFDPWLAGGVGFRRTTDGATSVMGVDWMRISLGGDWYPASNLGFGPIVELSLGTFVAESPGSLGAKAVNASFVIGGRIVFDAPGK